VNTFVQLVVNGLGKGAVFALLALGFVIIFKATGVVNFAHGSLVFFGGYLVVVTRDAFGWAGASLVGVLGAGVLGLLLERLLLSRSKHADANSLALLTIGVDVIITEEIVRRLGVSLPFIGEAWDAKPFQIGGITLFRTHVVALVVATVLITAFALAFKYSNWGVAMRAQAENREAAALMGIRSSRVTATAWLVAGMLADSATELFAARTMLYEVARSIDAGTDRKTLHAQASMAKLYCSEMAGRVADRAVQIFGGRGYMRENVAERMFRELRVERIWEGASEIQRIIVARQLMTRGPSALLDPA